MEKVSKRMQQIETVSNNIKVLKEMLTHYKENSASEAEKDLMKVNDSDYVSLLILFMHG